MKTKIIHLLFLSLLYFSYAYYQSGTSKLSIDIVVKNSSNAQLFFDYKEKNNHDNPQSFYLTEKKKNYTINLNENVDEIKAIRLDPGSKKGIINLNYITITDYHFFEKSIYKVPVTSLSFVKHIKNIKFNKDDSVTFSSIGNDPYLFIPFDSLELIEVYSDFYRLEFAFFLMIYVVFLRLINLYGMSEMNSIETAKLFIYGIFYFFFLYQVMYYAENNSPNTPPDERAHVSYIEHLKITDHVFPHFKNMEIRNGSNSVPNYLGHPALYYHLVNFFIPYKTANYKDYRVVSILLISLSLLLILNIGFSSQWSLKSHLIYAASVISLPSIAFIGGSVSNDNLAILGAVLLFWGMSVAMKNKDYTVPLSIAILGMFFAFFAKLTSGLLVVFASIIIVYYFWKNKIYKDIYKLNYIFFVVVVLSIVLYQIYIYLNYSAIHPSIKHLHPAYFYSNISMYVPESIRGEPLSLYSWAEKMWDIYLDSWFGIFSHRSLFKENLWLSIGLIIIHLTAIISFILIIKKDCENKTLYLLSKFFLVSLLLVVIIQYFFTYKGHLNNGTIRAFHSRYILPFWFVFPILAVMLLEKVKGNILIVLFILILTINIIYSDFFYLIAQTTKPILF